MIGARDVAGLRGRLRMNRTQFAKLCGVDARTVSRWESGDGSRPTGAALAVMTAIREKLDSDPGGATGVIKFLAKAAAMGGLAYVVLKLLGRVGGKEEEEER